MLRPRLAFSLVLLASIAACGGSAAYQRELAAGDRAASAGRYGEAADAYVAASRSAEKERNRAFATLRAAEAKERAGDVAGAAALYRTLAAGPGEYRATAEYRAALGEIAAGDKARGLAALDVFLRKNSGSGLALPALRQLLQDKEETGGNAAALAYLEGLLPSLRVSELGEAIAYGIAVRLVEVDKARARDAFLRVASEWPYPVGKYFDDSLFRAAELEEEGGNLRAAIAYLERMVRQRETTSIVGSYQRPRFGPALFHIGMLYGKLGEKDPAREAFHRLFTEYRTSTLRDDAAWEEAKIALSTGDRDAACRTLGDLVTELPDSRYVPCAFALCPKVVRPAKSDAPATCRPYLAAEIEPSPQR